jgi:anti-sigma B factor antagonist
VSLEPRDDGPVRVLVASGDIDVIVVPALLQGLPALLADATAVALDLTGATFFDSSGVQLVDRLTRTCAAASQAFVVVAPRGGPAWRVLDLVGYSGLAVQDLPAARARLLP